MRRYTHDELGFCECGGQIKHWARCLGCGDAGYPLTHEAAYGEADPPAIHGATHGARHWWAGLAMVGAAASERLDAAAMVTRMAVYACSDGEYGDSALLGSVAKSIMHGVHARPWGPRRGEADS